MLLSDSVFLKRITVLGEKKLRSRDIISLVSPDRGLPTITISVVGSRIKYKLAKKADFGQAD